MAEAGRSTPLACADPAASAEEVMTRFREDVYGRPPGLGRDLEWELLAEHVTANGMLRQQWALDVHTVRGSHRCVVMVDLPDSPEPVPAFLGLNFRGNHACTADPEVLDVQHRPSAECGRFHADGLREPVTLPVPRGVEAHRWPSELVTGRGYALITSCYLQCGPDSAEMLHRGLHPLLYPEVEHGAAPAPGAGEAATTGEPTTGEPATAERRDVTGATPARRGTSGATPARRDGDGGGLAMWAWMLSRILDAIGSGMCPGVEAGKVAVVGHSRLGKAALWAAAQDVRFAAAFSNDSGCMGAAASRPVGETPEVLARIRPYWFAPRFSATVLAGSPLPVDQHQLLAAIAPRPLYVASASDDANADPEGELLSLLASAPAWGVGADDLSPELPAPDTRRWWHESPLGYHLRRGGHDMMPWDWIQWLDFADRELS